jgi:hypothetical protein
MAFKDENMGTAEKGFTSSIAPRRTLAIFLLSGLLGLVAACGPRRLNVMHTTEQSLVAIGYAADRSASILRANNDAQEYCERQKRDVVFLKEDTVYQGHYNEDVTVAARTAGRVAGALGSSKGAQAGRSLSSSTDYKTTFEFVCQ